MITLQYEPFVLTKNFLSVDNVYIQEIRLVISAKLYALSSEGFDTLDFVDVDGADAVLETVLSWVEFKLTLSRLFVLFDKKVNLLVFK